MLHHDELDRHESLVTRVRAALDAHALPIPGVDAAGDLDTNALMQALTPLGFSFGGLRQTVDQAWRASYLAPDGTETSAQSFSREGALALAVLSALEGVPA